jgi:hypothetical protein
LLASERVRGHQRSRHAKSFRELRGGVGLRQRELPVFIGSFGSEDHSFSEPS